MAHETQARPETPAPASTVHRIIRDAITDPGKVTERNFLEEEPSRQAGAVVIALAVHGYRIVPADEPEQLQETGSASATAERTRSGAGGAL